MIQATWLLVYFSVLIWSAIRPHDYLTWALEVAPAVLGLIVLVATYRRFRLTNLSYLLILIHCIILMIGGHYTYAEVPLLDAINDLFGSGRNNYDKIGHLAQGFVPALLAREVLTRLNVIRGPRWLNFFVVTFALALSALYELIEWWVALVSGAAADAFLGTQGYVWDTQSDMALALLGAILAVMLLGKVQDRQLAGLRHSGAADRAA